MSPKARVLLWLVLPVFALDQLTKQLIIWYVHPLDPVRLIPGFLSITHARNAGAVFGLAQGLPVPVFLVLGAVALVLLFSFYRQTEPGDRFIAASLALILAGALGNLVDRLRHGAVVDWIQFDLGIFIFPDFNVADSAIVIGVGLLLIDLFVPETTPAVGEETDT